MGGRVKRIRHKGFMKGNRVLPFVVVVFLAAAILLTSVLILKQSFSFILAGNTATTVPASNSGVPYNSAESSGANDSAAVSSQISVDSLNSKSVDSASWFSETMFVGDSITLGISSYRLLSTADIYATNSMSTASALSGKAEFNGSKMTLAEAVSSKKPTKIFILLGSNDETYMSEDSFISNYEQIIDLITENSPSTEIYVQSIFPVTAALEKKSSKYSNETIEAFNQALSEICTSKGVAYRDIASLYKGSDGCMKSVFSGGGVNIKRSAYFLWLNYLTIQG